MVTCLCLFTEGSLRDRFRHSLHLLTCSPLSWGHSGDGGCWCTVWRRRELLANKSSEHSRALGEEPLLGGCRVARGWGTASWLSSGLS